MPHTLLNTRSTWNIIQSTAQIRVSAEANPSPPLLAVSSSSLALFIRTSMYSGLLAKKRCSSSEIFSDRPRSPVMAKMKVIRGMMASVTK